MAKHLRRSLRIQLRAVPLEAVAAAKERRDAGVIDVVPPSGSRSVDWLQPCAGCKHQDIFAFPTCQKLVKH